MTFSCVKRVGRGSQIAKGEKMRGMVYLAAFFCALSLTGINSGSNGESYLKSDEARWAKQLGVKQSYVREIVKTAGFSEDDQVRIDDLDLRHLSVRKHILLVTAAGEGHCLTLSVVARKSGSIQKVWELTEFPEGGGLCHDGARTGNFEVRATRSGVIIIDVPKDENGNYVLDGIKHLVYKWNGEAYVLNEQQRRRLS